MESEVEYTPGTGLTAARENLEKTMIYDALMENKWSKSKAADALKISRQYLFTLMNKYGIKMSLTTDEHEET